MIALLITQKSDTTKNSKKNETKQNETKRKRNQNENETKQNGNENKRNTQKIYRKSSSSPVNLTQHLLFPDHDLQTHPKQQKN